jgi:hypothetical protein
MPITADLNSKTQKALALYRDGVPVRQIIRQIDISQGTIYAAIKRELAKASQCCPKCGGPVDSGGGAVSDRVPEFLRKSQAQAPE